MLVIQLCVAIACLALGSAQQESIVELAWSKSNDDTKVDMMKALQCCGFRRVDLPPHSPMGHPPCKLANVGLECARV